MRTAMATILGLSLVFPLAAEAGKKKKKKGDDAPTEAGWFQGCYNPPDFTGMPSGPKRMAWQATRDAIIGQWRGNQSDGISFDDRAVENAETALLAEPARIEAVSKQNFELCMAKNNAAWGSWVKGLAGKLTEGECPSPPMDYTLYDYLSINDEWHIPVNVCEGDSVIIHGTDGDLFQITDGGPFINVAGDTSAAASGDLPCTTEGCYPGQLIMRFTSSSGTQVVLPVGLETTYTAHEHGRIEVMINDNSFADNKYKVEKGLEHHTGIEYKPAGK